MKSIVFEKKYGVKIDSLKTIKDIEDVVESQTGRKPKFSKSDSLIMARGGCVFDIVEYEDPNIKIDKFLASWQKDPDNINR